MQHVTYADKSLLVGDDAAEALIEYAAALGRKQISDSVRLSAISTDGNDVVATFLLSASAPLMTETAHSSLPEPDNAEAVERMRRQIGDLEHAPVGSALDLEDTAPGVDYDDIPSS